MKREKNGRPVAAAGIVSVLCLVWALGADAQEFEAKVESEDVYDTYIWERVIPEMGYAELDPSSQYIPADMAELSVGWDKRTGVLGADTADLDGDGTEELLIYYFGSQTNTDGTVQLEEDGALYADLYTKTEADEITFVGTQKLYGSDGLDFSAVHIGLMTVETVPYLYVEQISEGYFTESGDSGYVWFSYADGGFVPVWQLVQAGDFEHGLAYSLLTKKTDGSYDEALLWADGAYREQHTDVFVYTVEGSSLDEAVRLGFQILGLPEPGTGVSGYLYEAMPSYQNEDCLQQSVVYAEEGTEGQMEDGLLMNVTVEEFTGLRERLAALEDSRETEAETGEAEEETEAETAEMEKETEAETEEAEKVTEAETGEPEKETEAETEEAEKVTEAETTEPDESLKDTEAETSETEEETGEVEKETEAETGEPEKETEAETEEPEKVTEAETEEAEKETEAETGETEKETEAETGEIKEETEPETTAETESLTTVHVQVPARQYFASAQGYGGIVKVSVLIGEADDILNVSIVECDGEAEDIGRPAADRVSEEILAQQSAEVDTVSGATATSDAVIRSVEAVLMTVQSEKEQEKADETEGQAAAIQSEASENENTAAQPESQEEEKYSSLTVGEADFPITREESFWPEAQGEAQTGQMQPQTAAEQPAVQTQPGFPVVTKDSYTLPAGSAAAGDTSFYVNGTVVAQNQYIMPESGSRYLTAEDLSRLTQKGVSYAKNEIYAKHGRKFLAQELQEYFGRQSWYNGTIEAADFGEAQVNALFNEYEKANIRFISEWEASHGEYQY